MKISNKNMIATFMAVLLAGFPALQMVACGPFYPSAIIVNWSHPDLPLKLFAAGNLGIIQPGWARSYLIVAYRYLTNTPLDSREQSGIIRLWHSRLKEAILLSGEDTVSVVEAYLKLRASVMGTSDKNVPDVYSTASSLTSTQNIQADAFSVAKKTLEERIKKYGIKSNQVHEWIKGQDAVFGIDENSIPQPLTASADVLMRADRDYQIAAATFYAKNYAKAAQLFEQITQNSQSPWSTQALYLVARCKTNEALAGDNEDACKTATVYIESLLKKESNFQKRQDLLDLLGPLYYNNLNQDELIEHLIKSIVHEHSERFGRDVGDLTYIMDVGSSENSQKQPTKDSQQVIQKIDFQKYDLTDWLDTIQRPDDFWSFYSVDEQKKKDKTNDAKAIHAIDRWRQNHNLLWLVATMCCNGLRSPQLIDAFEAAKKLPPTSPAYITANFYVVDALIASNKKQEARQRLVTILNQKGLPPSAVNMFKAQLMAVSSNSNEFLHNAFMKMSGDCDSFIILSSDWLQQEANTAFATKGSVLDSIVARDLNRNLPLSLWLGLCRDKSLPVALHNRIIAATWLRAQLLNKQEIAAQLTTQFAAAYPTCSKLITKYTLAAKGDEQQFVLARLILSAFGMAPYVESGIPRHGNNFYAFDDLNANFWLPLVPEITDTSKKDVDVNYWGTIVQSEDIKLANLMRGYYKDGIRRVLSKEQKDEADRERLVIWKNHPSRFLGEAIITWAKAHPSDPYVPEMLYKIVRLPKWSERTDIGSLYSHKAYSLLHAHYLYSKWTDKATCWY